LGSGPSHTIRPREFLNKVLMLFIEENGLSHSAVNGQRFKVGTQLLNYQKLYIIPSVKYEYS